MSLIIVKTDFHEILNSWNLLKFADMLHLYRNSTEVTTVLHKNKNVNSPVSTDSTGVATVILYMDVSSQIHTPAALLPG
jgi:hypothetical protein